MTAEDLNVPCPYNNQQCPATCGGRGVSEQLTQWKADHPIPDVDPTATSSVRRSQQAAHNKAQGTHTFMTITAASQTANVCVNRPHKPRTR